MDSKRCSACGSEKLRTEFYKGKGKPHKDGTATFVLGGRCKTCSKVFFREFGEKWRKSNVEAYKKYRRTQMREWRRRVRLQVIEHLGGKCLNCGFSDVRALQIDHIKGGGNAQRKLYASGNNSELSRRILSLPRTNGIYQLLCANCNWIKKEENQEHSGIKGI